MIRAVLDANVFVSALISPKGPPGQLIERWLNKRTFDLIVSPAILEELRRCLGYKGVRKYVKASKDELDAWVTAIGLNAEVVPGVITVDAVEADPDDDKYVSAAIEGLAQYVVSGDAHLLELRVYESIRIVKPKAFLDVLDGR